jgi:hypothetical protein
MMIPVNAELVAVSLFRSFASNIFMTLESLLLVNLPKIPRFFALLTIISHVPPLSSRLLPSQIIQRQCLEKKRHILSIHMVCRTQIGK